MMNAESSRPRFHHLLQVNGQLLPEDDDDDTDDSFEPEIVKVCLKIINQDFCY